MLTTDKALDMLPHVADLYDKLQIEDYRKSIADRYAEKGGIVDRVAVGIEVFKYIFKNVGKAKDEVIQIVAIAQDKTPQEVKNQSLASTIKGLKDVFSDKELVDFFKQAMQ